MHIQSISLELLAHQRQGSLMAYKKGKKRAALSPASASVINAKAIVPLDPITNQKGKKRAIILASVSVTNAKATVCLDPIANQKGKKTATISASVSVTNAKATLAHDTIAAIASPSAKSYGRKLAERVQQWNSQSHDIDPALKDHVLQKLMDLVTKSWAIEGGKFPSYPL